MKFRRGLIAGSFIVAGGLLALGTVVLKEMQEARRTQALEASANVVATLEADIARNIELYALSLEAVVDNLAEPEVHTVSNKLRHLILFDRSATAKHLGNMHVLDEKGYELINSRTLEPRKESFAERDYFQAHRDNPDAGLYIGKPFATPTKGTYVIGISRRLSHLDGSFGGVVAGTLRLSFFQELFARVALEPGSSIGLFRMDGTMIIRSPFKAEDIGRNIGKGAEVFKRALAAPVGQFETVAALDGVNRFYSYRRVGNFPLFISLGNSTAAIYAAWPGEAAVLIAVVLALALATIALAVFASRELRRRASAEKLCGARQMAEGSRPEWRARA